MADEFRPIGPGRSWSLIEQDGIVQVAPERPKAFAMALLLLAVWFFAFMMWKTRTISGDFAWAAGVLGTIPVIIWHIFMVVDHRNGPYVVVNTAAGNISIPRRKVTIDLKNAIAWKLKQSWQNGSHLTELSLTTKSQDGNANEFIIVASEDYRSVAEVHKKLGKLTGVELVVERK
jgi:hypothetical protein